MIAHEDVLRVLYANYNHQTEPLYLSPLLHVVTALARKRACDVISALHTQSDN